MKAWPAPFRTHVVNGRTLKDAADLGCACVPYAPGSRLLWDVYATQDQAEVLNAVHRERGGSPLVWVHQPD